MPQNNQRNNQQNAKIQHCLAEVAKNDAAGTALDAASIIPGGGDLADVARLGAGTVSFGISAFQAIKMPMYPTKVGRNTAPKRTRRS